MKGAPAPAHTLQIRLKPASAGAGAPPPMSEGEEPAPAAGPSQPPFGFMKAGKSNLGFWGGVTSNKLDLTASNTIVSETINLSGNGVIVGGFLDMQMSKLFTIRAGSSYQTFEGKGTTKTSSFCNGLDCSFGVTYLTAEAIGQINVINTRSRTRVWLGAGGEFMFAISKRNAIPALKTDDSTNNFLYVSAGADISLDSSSFIPVGFDVGMQPTAGSGAKASLTIMRIGYGWHY